MNLSHALGFLTSFICNQYFNESKEADIGCERRIEVFVKVQKKTFFLAGGGGGGGGGGGLVRGGRGGSRWM